MNEQDTSMMEDFATYWGDSESNTPKINIAHTHSIDVPMASPEKVPDFTDAWGNIKGVSFTEGLKTPAIPDDIKFIDNELLTATLPPDSFLTYNATDTSFVAVPQYENLNDQIIVLKKEVAEMRSEMNNHTQPVVQQIKVRTESHTPQFMVDRARPGSDMTAVGTYAIAEAERQELHLARAPYSMGAVSLREAEATGRYIKEMLATEPNPFVMTVEDFELCGISMIKENDEKDFEYAMELAK